MIQNLRRASRNILFYPTCSWQQFVVQAGNRNQSITPGSKHQDKPTLCRIPVAYHIERAFSWLWWCGRRRMGVYNRKL